MPDTLVRVDFLKKLHLFRGLSDDQLKSVAEEMHEQTFEEPDTVFIQGMPADALFFIYQGRVNIHRKSGEKDIKVATLVRGDYFGEQGLLASRKRNATVHAEKGTILLVLYREHFRKLLRKVPGLRSNFEIMISSRRLAGSMRFKWLGENEVIYFIARKHPMLLYQSLFLPALLFFVVLLILGLAALYTSATFAIVGGIALLLDVGWLAWNYVDWGNDYYIVTNQRVIWLEKVIGLYDSRTEAGMSTILSVNTETDYWGRVLNYGTVVVRTFTGQIRMTYVQYPKQASTMIEEYWNRSKEGARQADQEGIKQVIRSKLGYGPAPRPAAAPASAPKPEEKKPSPLQDWWRDAFRMRIEEGGIVTYRKHVFVLFRDTWIQNIVFIALISTPILWASFVEAPPLWLLAVVILGLFINTVTWIYQYLDWSNDVYQVTADQIIDINRKPFGTEDRKAAPLENILSTEYKRRGILGMLLNFGTVFIMVGGAQFNFENVADPPTVQQDIVRRQQVRQQKKREAESAGERERLAEWLAMYHRTVEEIQREKDQSRPEKPE